MYESDWDAGEDGFGERDRRGGVIGIEDLRQKRDHVGKCIEKEERDKAIVQKELATLTEKLHRLNESIAQKVTARTEYDRTIHETEAAYMKVSSALSSVWLPY